ncbi:beta/gamma crystallin-related protein [uncultured Winogradskyella sp.]|uniref:beta/gamma crystallin-related protein n=1 Tax=uncultured Winogradskyella sp. TaxID=395353 RepID=UPI00262F7C40|nr:beta/gamma crystallin-related protein [uncultured Winogradskyella sp.]
MKNVVLALALLGTLAFAPANDSEAIDIDMSLYNSPVIYQHAAFNRNDPGGAQVSIACTEFNFDNVGWNDTISSIYIPSGQGWVVEIFEASHFEGRSYRTSSSIVNLEKIRFNDIVSSIKIYKRGVLQGDCIWR